MTTGGWIFLVASWAGILALFVFALARTLRASENYVEKGDSAEETKKA